MSSSILTSTALGMALCRTCGVTSDRILSVELKTEVGHDAVLAVRMGVTQEQIDALPQALRDQIERTRTPLVARQEG